MAVQTRMVTDADEFRCILAAARNAHVVGIDCEADVVEFKKPNGKTSIDPRTFEVVGGSLYLHQGGRPLAYYFPFLHVEGENLPDGCRAEWLQFMALELLDGDASIDAPRRWVHNQNAEVQMLRNHGLMAPIDEPHGARDSMIAAWLLGYGGDREEGSGFEALGLKDLRVRVLGLGSRREFSDISKGRRASEVPSHEMSEYAALDAYDTAMIGETLWPRLVEANLAAHMLDIDGPMADVCRGMEEEGWDIDTDAVVEFGGRMQEEARAIAQRFTEATTCLTIDVEDLPTQIGVYKNGNPQFKKLPTQVVKVRGGNVANDRDCARFIFSELRALPRAKATINKDGTPSLKRENIEHFLASHAGTLGAELVQMRFDYKMRSTLVQNFVTPFIELPKNYRDGRLHSRFEVTGTSTQRLSSSNPNTQNCPSRTEEGKAIRKAMVAPPGWSVGCFDMSQAELRVAAHFSKDPELLACYSSDPEIDVHAGTLQLLHTLGWETAKRVDAKTTNFSSMYGITDKRLAVKMKCRVDQAAVALDAHHVRFARYWEWNEEACEYVKAHGHIRTLDGFKRPLDPTLHWDKFRRCNDLHWSVRNQVANSAIQGSVAGIAKIAMVAAKREFVAEGLWDSHVRFRAQEHDSIVPVARDEVRDHVADVIRRCIIEAAPGLRVKMKVDGGWGKSWGEAKG